VKTHVHVEPSGRVRDVTVERSPDAKLGECVNAAMRTARFAATQRGGSFWFPAVF
jgi:TonB family protein